MSKTINTLLNTMSIEEKIGQMLCFGFCGSYAHPDIMEMIERYHVAGFRVTPHSKKFSRYFGPDNPATARVVRPLEPKERCYSAGLPAPDLGAKGYAAVLNTLRQRAIDTGAGIPLYFALDFEGNQSMNFQAPNIQGFPQPMGLAASRDPDLCRQAARVIARQMKAIGINWLHSPVLDVNTAPLNPEIGTRSYSARADEVIEYATATLAGFDEMGIIATGKHFPGRGASVEDVHFGVARIAVSHKAMHDIHLAPYKALIKKGLPAIMLAHSIFPGIDPDEEIATLSRAVITDVLRGELGFEGVIMTDSFTMGGLVAKYEVVEAAIRCIEAGVDLILLKDENALRGEVYEGLLQAVRQGRITEERLESAVRRVLTAKERAGLFDEDKGLVSPEQTEALLADPENREVATRAAAKSVHLLRDHNQLIPIKPGTRVLVIEEAADLQCSMNNAIACPGSLYHQLLESGVAATYLDYRNADTLDTIWDAVETRAAEADLIVHTGWYLRGNRPEKAAHDRIQALNKPAIFVTNCPFPTIVSETMQTVIVTFSVVNTSLRAAADVITGAAKATATLGFDPSEDLTVTEA